MTGLTCDTSAAACQALGTEMQQVTLDLLFASMVTVVSLWALYHIFTGSLTEQDRQP